MNEIDKEIYELGELEREVADMARYYYPGKLMWRMLKWLERQFCSLREEAKKERDQMKKESQP